MLCDRQSEITLQKQKLYQMWQVFVSRLISQAVPALWFIKILVVIQTK